MATIGLRVVQPANPLSLADTLAKGIFGDPEAAARAQLMGAQIRAHDAYASKLGADANLINVKTKEEQALEDARNAAANPAGNALAASLPAPVPVVHVPSSDWLSPDSTTVMSASTGDVSSAPPAIVTPDEQARNDAERAALRASGPLIVRMGDNPNAYIESLGKGFGLGTLLGAQGGAVSPTSARIGSELYTGKTPTTTDVTAPGDVAGVNAAANADIAKEAAKPIIRDVSGGLVNVNPRTNVATPVQGAEPQAPKIDTTSINQGLVTVSRDANGNVVATPVQGAAPQAPKPELKEVNGTLYKVNPDGSVTPVTGAPPGKDDIREVNGQLYKINPDGSATRVQGVAPKEPTIKESGGSFFTVNPDGSVSPTQGGPQAPPKIENLSPNEAHMVFDPSTGRWVPAPGAPQPAPPPSGTYGADKTVPGQQNQLIEQMSQKFLDPNAMIAPNEALAYAQAYNGLYGIKIETHTDNLGNTQLIPVQQSAPQGAPLPAEVLKRAGIAIQAPTQSAQAPPGPNGPAIAAGPQGPSAAVSGPLAGPVTTVAGPAKPPTQEQANFQNYAELLASSTAKLDKITPDQVPSVAMQQIMGIRGNDPTVAQSIISSWIASPQTRAFGQAAAEFNQALLYMLSGKAITHDEYIRALTAYMPQPGEQQDVLNTKTAERHRIIANAVRLGYGNDPAGGQKKIADWKAQGLDITDASRLSGAGAILDEPPPGLDPGLWSHMDAAGRKAFGR